MKKVFYIKSLLIIFLFGCVQDKEAELKNKIIPTIETFLTSMLDKAILDSVIITKIDTVTPLIAKRIELLQVIEKYEQQAKAHKLQVEMVILKSEQFRLYKSLDANDKTMLDIMYRDVMSEKEKVDNINLELEELNKRSEKLSNEINSNSLDSTTFLNYLITAKITITNPDKTQETKELPMQITKDFKIIKK